MGEGTCYSGSWDAEGVVLGDLFTHLVGGVVVVFVCLDEVLELIDFLFLVRVFRFGLDGERDV